MPVLKTPVTNLPSKARSRVDIAFQPIVSSKVDSCLIMMTFCQPQPVRASRILRSKQNITRKVIESRKKLMFLGFMKMIPKAILHRSKMVARRRASVGGIAGFSAIMRTTSGTVFKPFFKAVFQARERQTRGEFQRHTGKSGGALCDRTF